MLILGGRGREDCGGGGGGGLQLSTSGLTFIGR